MVTKTRKVNSSKNASSSKKASSSIKKKTGSSIKKKASSSKKSKMSDVLKKVDKYGKYESAIRLLKYTTNLNKFKKFYKKLDKKLINSLMDYKGSGFIKINKFLYDKLLFNEFKIDSNFILELKNIFKNKKTKELITSDIITSNNIGKFIELYVNNKIINNINIIDKIFARDDIPKLTGDEIVYRGIHNIENKIKNLKIGETITMQNFISTSTNINVSMDFTRTMKDKPNKPLCCLYIISKLKNVPYIYLPWAITKIYNTKTISMNHYDEFEYLLPRGIKFKIKNIEIINTNSISDSFSLDKFNKILAGLNVNTSENQITENNLDKIINKIDKKIKVYYLEYIETEKTEEIKPFVFDSKIKISYNLPKDKTKTNIMYSHINYNNSSNDD